MSNCDQTCGALLECCCEVAVDLVSGTPHPIQGRSRNDRTGPPYEGGIPTPGPVPGSVSELRQATPRKMWKAEKRRTSLPDSPATRERCARSERSRNRESSPAVAIEPARCLWHLLGFDPAAAANSLLTESGTANHLVNGVSGDGHQADNGNEDQRRLARDRKREAPAANGSESRGRKGITTRPVSTKMTAPTMTGPNNQLWPTTASALIACDPGQQPWRDYSFARLAASI